MGHLNQYYLFLLQITLPVMLPADQWVLWLQQIMFVILVIGRWLLPKGHLTHDQLSQLLMFYLGTALDSLEFSIATLSIGEVFCNRDLIFAVLFIWTLSMMQFTLVLSPVPQNGGINFGSVGLRAFVGCCAESEITLLLVTALLQDGPFLIMRVFLMLRFKVVNEMMLIFVAKNFLVVVIQLYRVVIFINPHKSVGTAQNNDVYNQLLFYYTRSAGIHF